MSRPISVIEEQLQDTNVLIKACKELIEKFPNDWSLEMSLKQNKSIKNALLKELEHTKTCK